MEMRGQPPTHWLLYPWANSPDSYQMGCCVGPTASVGILDKRQIAPARI